MGESVSWAEILSSCNGHHSYGCGDQFVDISWQSQGRPISNSSVSLSNLVGFDDQAQTSFGSHGDLNMVGGGFHELDGMIQEEQHKAMVSGPLVANSDLVGLQKSSEVQVQPLKTCRRTQIQRVNHILAERQRREEMNDKFSILRSFIPRPIKKDKASIIAETIDYVIEMERTLRHLKECKAERQACQVPSKLRKSGASDTFQKLNITSPSQSNTCQPSINTEEPRTRTGQWKSGEVEVEEVGGSGYAVIKIRGRRRRGVVKQIHVALEECKLDVLQSTITTVGDMMVLFTTVQMCPGVSADMNSLVHTIAEASSKL